MNEEWKTIAGYENYQVSSYGRVKSRCFSNERILKQFINKDGYFVVRIYSNKKGKTFYTHALVAEAFLTENRCCPTCNTRYEVNHLDENPLNNNSNNLEYVTRIENVKKSAIKASKGMVAWSKIRPQKRTGSGK